MRSLRDASTSWQELKQYHSLAELRESVRLDGHTSAAASAGLRSACWKAFLLFDSVETATWPKTLASSRSAYNSLRLHFLQYLENPADDLEAGYDPLSEDAESTSSRARFTTDADLRAEIQQDVDRCMPEILYFRQPDTQRMLLDILFIFCKLNPDVGYRQGMHELLAPILWVIERDAIDLGPSSKALGEDAVIRAVFDAEHVEHDAFALFSQVMHSAKNFYEQTTHSGQDNPMVLRSRRIFNDLLPQVDPELAQHLATIDIVPQVFLLRWIRLLFGREFSFDDMLTVWDVVFAEDTSLELVDHVCLAMLLRIRWELLDADYNAALTLLLRYPQPEKDYPAQTFALDALYLREHMNTEGSGYLVLKYTGRPLQRPGRPSTPPALLRNITTFSGANATRAVNAARSAGRGGRLSPPAISRQRSNIEAIMQSTAKNIYARSEKLGIGKAVRSAVDEVHKRAAEIRETGPPSLPPRPAARGGYGALYGRVKALEERNRQLAKLLEGAVGELWDCQRLAADKGAAGGSAGGEGPGSDVEQLSIAVAKVQFVQVYLADPSLPLPEDEKAEQQPEGHATADVLGTDAALGGHREPEAQAPEGVVEASGASAVQRPELDAQMGELADPSTFEDAEGSPLATPGPEPPAASAGPSRAEKEHANPSSPTARAAAKHVGARAVTPAPDSDAKQPTSRPALAEGSYSWMLGAEKQPFDRSATTLPEHARKKSFLFGDNGGDDAAGSKKLEKRGAGRERGKKVAAAAAEVAEEHNSFDLNTLQRSRGAT
ncbi:hypothetical protein LTR85_004164 [Meristemomyces frigidus]|nr:hypothetical protein LTR85_004164 [Meristemomyces frigidus]